MRKARKHCRDHLPSLSLSLSEPLLGYAWPDSPVLTLRLCLTRGLPHACPFGGRRTSPQNGWYGACFNFPHSLSRGASFRSPALKIRHGAPPFGRQEDAGAPHFEAVALRPGDRQSVPYHLGNESIAHFGGCAASKCGTRNDRCRAASRRYAARPLAPSPHPLPQGERGTENKTGRPPFPESSPATLRLCPRKSPRLPITIAQGMLKANEKCRC